MPLPDKKKMKKIGIVLILLLIAAVLIWFIFGWLYGPSPSGRTLPQLFSSYFRPNTEPEKPENLIPAEGDVSFLRLPEGFEVKVFAEKLGGPNPYIPGVNWGVRQMTTSNSKEGNGKIVYATIHKEGKVVSMLDKDGDGTSDEQKVFLENLSLPHGIEIYEDWVYIAENDKITRVKDADRNGETEGEREKILDLPPFLEHWTRTVRIFAQNEGEEPQIFVSIGSSCNGCIESNPWRASIIRCDVDGKNCNVFASGLRNSVDFTFYKNQIWATDAGRDFLGNNLPPEEVNIIKEGKNYGWPYCYGKQIHDVTFDQNTNPCPQTEGSFVDLAAHSTAIGISGYTGNSFPEKWRESLYVALHGSYQSKPPVGYKIVRVNPKTRETEDFLTGFAAENKTFGRPVHILNYQNGLLVSDDMKGKIYFVSWKGK